jgi:hypothetical protein
MQTPPGGTPEAAGDMAGGRVVRPVGVGRNVRRCPHPEPRARSWKLEGALVSGRRSWCSISLSATARGSPGRRVDGNSISDRGRGMLWYFCGGKGEKAVGSLLTHDLGTYCDRTIGTGRLLSFGGLLRYNLWHRLSNRGLCGSLGARAEAPPPASPEGGVSRLVWKPHLQVPQRE